MDSINTQTHAVRNIAILCKDCFDKTGLEESLTLGYQGEKLCACCKIPFTFKDKYVPTDYYYIWAYIGESFHV
jgi:hypothetical protein